MKILFATYKQNLTTIDGSTFVGKSAVTFFGLQKTNFSEFLGFGLIVCGFV